MAVALREKKISGGKKVSFYLDIYHSGKRWYEFLGIHARTEKPAPADKSNRQLAEEICIRRQHELIVDNHGLIDKQMKLGDFVDFFEQYIDSKKSNSNRSSTLYQLKRFVGKQCLPIAKVTTSWLKEFESFLLKTISVNSALSYLKNVGASLNYLVSKQVIARNPWHAVPRSERLKKKDTKRTAWTIEQLARLAATSCNIKQQYRQAYFFACFTGLRWSDTNGLRWDNIMERYFDGKLEWFIHFTQQKTDSSEYFPLSDQAISILKSRKQESAGTDDGGYIFPQVKETDSKNKLVQARVNYALKKWAKAAGLDHTRMHFHTGRHSYATNLLERTGELYTVSKLLGHKSIQTTQIYAQVRDTVKYAAVKALPCIELVSGSSLPTVDKAA
ncbi:MAG TPA: site-specific integrase [Ohtaekwangia sp.]|uniref:site-specific integrase n=1 Tax=Ohtaekwangia sp. TaxID=2066019 RepID=UPI002F9200B4